MHPAGALGRSWPLVIIPIETLPKSTGSASNTGKASMLLRKGFLEQRLFRAEITDDQRCSDLGALGDLGEDALGIATRGKGDLRRVDDPRLGVSRRTTGNAAGRNGRHRPTP